MPGRRFAAGLRLDSSYDVEAEASGKVGPCRMVCDETSVSQTFEAVDQLGAQLIETSDIDCLVATIILGMVRVHLDQCFRDVSYHRHGILGVEPDMWITL